MRDPLRTLRWTLEWLEQARDVEEFARSALERLCQDLEAEAGSLLLLDKAHQELYFLEAVGEKGEQVRCFRLQRGEGIAGWVAEHQQAVRIADAYADPRFCRRIDQATGFITRSVLCVPLRGRAEVQGALEMLNKRRGEFTFEDEELLSMVAEPVALLVENSLLIRRLQRRMQELNTLMEVNRSLSRLYDLPSLLHTIIRGACQVTEAEAGSFLLRDPQTGRLQFYIATGEKAEMLHAVEMERGVGIVGWAVEHGEVVFVPHAERDSRFHAAIDQLTGFRTRSVLCVPVEWEGEVLGAIEVVNLPEPMDAEVVELLRALASQAALAIERAWRYQSLQGRLEEADQRLLNLHQVLLAQKARLQTLVHSLPDAVVLLNEREQVVLCNPAAERLLQMVGSEVLGLSRQEVLERWPDSPLAQALQSSPGETQEMQVGSRFLRIYRAPVQGIQEGPWGELILGTDVTDLRRWDEWKHHLLSFASHELSAPLTSIKNVVATLQRSGSIDPNLQQEMLALMDQECDRLQSMVADFLDLSRLEAGRPLELHWRLVDLREVLERLRTTWEWYAPNCPLHIEVPPTLPSVEADGEKVEQILRNLLTNALKYSPPGRPVRIRVEALEEHLRISVQDQGVGIPPEEIPRLFQPFTRLHQEVGGETRGSGLGLYLVKHLVLAHGGQVGVESTPGKGSTFFFTLPYRQRCFEDLPQQPLEAQA